MVQRLNAEDVFHFSYFDIPNATYASSYNLTFFSTSQVTTNESSSFQKHKLIFFPLENTFLSAERGENTKQELG